MQWAAYYTLEGIYAWLDDLVAVYPSVASIITAGTSYEGREIKGIKISHGSGRKAVFIEAGIHAREWISPATTNYVINQLLSSDDAETRAAARDYDWYIFPVTNPDGYIWTYTENRLWRKNRQPYGSEFGVDLNRNWNSNWLKESVSINPSSNNYAGPGPFSEPEAKVAIGLFENDCYNLGQKIRYDDYALYKILPNESQIKILQDLQDNDARYDFWSEPGPNVDYVSVLSSPENKLELENFLKKNGIDFDIPISNIQEEMDKEPILQYARSNIKSMTWNGYYNLSSINAWLDDIALRYPETVNVIVGGTSYEGREIKGLRISHGSGRKIIFIESGIHSREWITMATVCYIINQLVTSDDPETQAAARDFDWYIFPVTNPDGYAYSHESDRLWRKNRRPIVDTTYGVDLNRNWNNNWLREGASINPSLQTYAGPGPFSEPETRSLSNYIRGIGDRIELYLSFHSYGQLLMLPFGNTTEPVGNYHDAMNIGRRAMGALSVRYGTVYTTGNIAEAIYLATGGSVDWVKEHVKVPLVYCYELRDRGNYGFQLPSEQILPTSEETMDSVLELVHQAKRFGYLN
ncbi:zinc carboxypeptidase [Aphomia sociella]